MVRIFTESDIEKWNLRLKSINLRLSYLNGTIDIIRIDDLGYCGGRYYTPSPLSEMPTVKYNLNYLISKKSMKRFDDLLKDILYTESEYYFFSNDPTKVKSNCRSLNILPIEESVKIQGIEYIKRSLLLNLPIVDIITYSEAIETCIEIISNYFEYDSDGNEISKTKFKVNEIVSTKEDRSSDWMVSYIGFSIDGKNPVPYYRICQIHSNIGSEVVLLGQNITVYEDFLLPNRNSRIDDILR